MSGAAGFSVLVNHAATDFDFGNANIKPAFRRTWFQQLFPLDARLSVGQASGDDAGVASRAVCPDDIDPHGEHYSMGEVA